MRRSTDCPGLKGGEGEVAGGAQVPDGQPACRMRPEGNLRTRLTSSCAAGSAEEEDGMEVMVPRSEGWPPPWGWKIVSFVATPTGLEEITFLKRDCSASGRLEMGRQEITVLVSSRSVASCWYRARVGAA